MLRRCLAMVALGGLMTVLAVGGSLAADKPADIETIMKKIAGKKGLCASCKTAGTAEKWEDALKSAKELKALTADLGKNACPKGDKESWTKLCKKYAEQGESIYAAAEKKDGAALNKALGAFTSSCKACHDSHK